MPLSGRRRRGRLSAMAGPPPCGNVAMWLGGAGGDAAVRRRRRCGLAATTGVQCGNGTMLRGRRRWSVPGKSELLRPVQRIYGLGANQMCRKDEAPVFL